MIENFKKTQEDRPAEKEPEKPGPVPASPPKQYDSSKTNLHSLFNALKDMKVSDKPPQSAKEGGFDISEMADGRNLYLSSSNKVPPESVLNGLPKLVRDQILFIDEVNSLSRKWNKKFDTPLAVMSGLASALSSFAFEHELGNELISLAELMAEVVKRSDMR